VSRNESDDATTRWDPVLVRRARFARLAQTGQRVGYGLIAVSVVGFVLGLLIGFSIVIAATVIVALVGTTVTLLPGIILDYSVKAAEREDRKAER
jgi:hypothetical protein